MNARPGGWLGILDVEAMAHVDRALASYVHRLGPNRVPATVVALAESIHTAALTVRTRQDPSGPVTPVHLDDEIGDGDGVMLLSLGAVVERLGVSESTIARRRQAGELRAIKIGRLVRFHPEEIERFQAGRPIDPTEPSA